MSATVAWCRDRLLHLTIPPPPRELYQMHCLSGISRRVYQNPVIKVKPLSRKRGRFSQSYTKFCKPRNWLRDLRCHRSLKNSKKKSQSHSRRIGPSLCHYEDKKSPDNLKRVLALVGLYVYFLPMGLAYSKWCRGLDLLGNVQSTERKGIVQRNIQHIPLEPVQYEAKSYKVCR